MAVKINLNGETLITMREDEYEQFRRRLQKLQALEAGGVDNWEGYATALEGYADDEEESQEEIYGDTEKPEGT